MDDPFAAALDALFSAPGAAAAVYLPKSLIGSGAIRVIRSQPDDTVDFGRGKVSEATNILQIRISDAPDLVKGDQIVFGANTATPETLTMVGIAMRDVEGLTWTMGAEAA